MQTCSHFKSVKGFALFIRFYCFTFIAERGVTIIQAVSSSFSIPQVTQLNFNDYKTQICTLNSLLLFCRAQHIGHDTAIFALPPDVCGKHGHQIVNAAVSAWSGPSLHPYRAHCVVFLSKTVDYPSLSCYLQPLKDGKCAKTWNNSVITT